MASGWQRGLRMGRGWRGRYHQRRVRHGIKWRNKRNGNHALMAAALWHRARVTNMAAAGRACA